jgi:hypothetical protein
MRPYPQGRPLSSLDGMKQNTAFLHAVVQTTPTMKRRRRWRRRRGTALFLRRWAPLELSSDMTTVTMDVRNIYI